MVPQFEECSLQVAVNCELIFCEHHGTLPIRYFVNDEGMSTGFCTVCLKQYSSCAGCACIREIYVHFIQPPHFEDCLSSVAGNC